MVLGATREMVIPEPVVVLGGGGFIGSHLVARLAREGAEVHAVDVAFPDERRQWFGEAFHIRYLDMLDADQALSAVAAAGTVFHLAADMGGVGYFHSDADLGAAMCNGRMTLNVLEACEGRVERVVYTASACAYPIESAGLLFSECMLGTGTPDQLYGAEKLHGLRLCGKVPGARVVVLDTIYGPGAEHDGPRAKFPASVAAKALRARETGTLELWGDGTQQRCFLYVDDAVDRVLAVATHDSYDGPVNLSGSRQWTCRAVAELCLQIAGDEAEIVTDPTRPSGVHARRLSTAKFERVYGPRPERSLEDGFTAVMEWLDR